MTRVDGTGTKGRPPIEIEIAEPPAVDEPTVTPAGERLERFIDGVRVRPAITHSDERGSVSPASSPTQGLIQEVFLGNANRGLLRIPAGVFHAVVNVGPEQLVYINMPTKPYRHDRPDKERLPADTTAIPYRL